MILRTIDADALKAEINDKLEKVEACAYMALRNEVSRLRKGIDAAIDSAPTIDTEPVRLRIDTAEVDAEKGWYEKLFYCRCGQLIKTEMWNEKYCFGSGTVLKANVMPKHCPNCGAKMDLTE